MRNTKRLRPSDIVIIRFITNCTRADLAQRLGFSYVYLSKIEVGSKPISTVTEKRIRDALMLTDDKIDQIRSLYKKLEQMGDLL